MRKILLLLFFVLPLTSFAQFTITGKILDMDDKKPVPDASVFLSNATNGTTSGKNGAFVIYDVKPGKYTLVVSVVGYVIFTENVLVNANVKIDDIQLQQDNKQLKEVVIKPKQEDPYRQSYLTMFKQQFLGKTQLAEECKLLNPEVLDLNFDDDKKKLTVTSDGFLEIENDALGYKLKYLVEDFVYIASPDSNLLRYKGNLLFEPLKGTPAQQKRWDKAREEVYANSPMHFYRALLSGNLKENGFNAQEYAHYNNPDRPSDSVIMAKLTYFKKNHLNDSVKLWKKINEMPKMRKALMTYSLSPEEIASRTNLPGLYALGCENNGLLITYEKNRSFPNFKLDHVNNPINTECTLITFKNLFVFFDSNGSVVDPYSLIYQGVWANERVAQLLPVDYDDGENITAPVDSTVANKVVASLQDYSSHHVVEKAYLHFDKPYYAAGDTMYFKAYLTVGPMHQLSALSGVLHVDLIGNNKIIKSLNLAVNSGTAWGDFELPDSLVNGVFRVRAYTQWMRNNKDPGFFDQIIPVSSANAKNSAISVNTATPSPAKPDIQFLPEGSSLVAGINSKVAFKAVGTNGLGIAVKGEVIDNDNKVVSEFSSAHLGMGYFYLAPVEGKTYRAKVDYANGVSDVVDIPSAATSGVELSVNTDSTETIGIKIKTNNTFLKANKGKDYTLIIYSGGTLTNIIVPLDSLVTAVDILKGELHTGIAKITLFSPAGEPLNERLVFVQKYDQLKLSVRSDKQVYTPRGKVNIDIAAVNSDSEPTIGEFSVAVTDETKEPVDVSNENTILNKLLLTSDLKGYVEQPNYYFIASKPDQRSSLDLLMLTQGYSGFEWKDVLNNKPAAAAYQPENSLSLSGNVKTLTGKPLESAKVTLLSTNPYTVKDTTTDVNGNFTFTGLNFIDTARLVLSAVKKNNSSYVKIEVNKPEYPAVIRVNSRDSVANIITPEIVQAMQKQMAQRQGNMKTGIMLKQVNIRGAKGEHPFEPKLTHSANLNGAGNANQVILGSQLVGCTNLALCLQSLLHGVRFSGNPSSPTIYSLRTPIQFVGATQPMAVIVDGVVRDQSVLTELAEDDVYSIEVLISAYYLTVYGSQAAGGAIVITTKRGNDSHSPYSALPGSGLYTFNGYHKEHTFYSPKYEATIPAKQPDTRTTIYWEPQLITGTDGKAAIEFYNADAPGTYRVVIEGIDANGNLGRAVYHYTVK
jgi:hypothetical protein